MGNRCYGRRSGGGSGVGGRVRGGGCFKTEELFKASNAVERPSSLCEAI